MLVIAVIAYVLIRRLAGEPAQAKRMLVIPAILVIVGLKDLHGVTGAALAYLVVTGLVTVVLGALRGASIRLFQREGVVFMRYTAVTLGLWVLNIAVKFGSSFLMHVLDPAAATAAGNTLMLSLGLGVLVEGLVVLAKAVRGEGRILWEKGRDGGPHRSAQWLDDLQRRYSGRGPLDR
ncbi:hypothetical protein GCM10017566_28070 [Amycolatopsis bartoniae]|uniref:DUF1453 domain-containing protein n=1 Tax=Amycolatopsis bartoniae TaxID=941986 RepID=A0A8H9IZ45_9PSEU|nr:hypothetical protein GCM10017566_28070 [Amycolatopsis bartoniae]